MSVLSPSPPRRAAAPLATVVALVVLSGCAPAPASLPQPTGTAYEQMPVPGRTIAPDAPAADLDLSGQRIALVLPDQDAATQTMADAISATAEDAGASVEAFPVEAEDTVDDAFAAAVESAPEIVVGVGEGTVDVFSYETAQRLEQQFLLLGGQLPEPTENVTAVIWSGATSRGSGAPADGDSDSGSITLTRAAEAAASGLESVQAGVVGVVLHLGD